MPDNSNDDENADDDLLPTFPRSLGIRLTETGKDLVVGEMDVTDAFSNRNGVMHGGAIMAFIDSISGSAAALNLQADERTTTLESKTNFLRPIAIGQRITARCEPVHVGRKTHMWQTTVFREDGKIAALTTQTQMTLEWSPPTSTG